MKKLITLTDYVMEQEVIWRNSKVEIEDDLNYIFKTSNYAKFLSMPLELKMFVPCDSENNVLEGPHNCGLLNTYPTGNKLMDKVFDPALEYQKAKSEVIFEGFRWYYGIHTQFAKKRFDYVDEEFCETRTIEDIVKEFDNLTLTPEAIQKYKF